MHEHLAQRIRRVVDVAQGTARADTLRALIQRRGDRVVHALLPVANGVAARGRGEALRLRWSGLQDRDQCGRNVRNDRQMKF